MLKQWLECGFIDKGMFYNTAEGTPQAGIISPTLMLLTMAGLEKLVNREGQIFRLAFALSKVL